MPTITIGLDIAKHVFQVHGIDAAGQVIVRKKLRRKELLEFFNELPPCLVGMEACGTANHWGRQLIALGHNVRLMPTSYVKPYVKRGKNDAADAEAICEAVSRPTMRFVPVKTAEQQSVLMLHRTRDLLVRQRTMLVNSLRGQLAEFGLIAPQGSLADRRIVCSRPGRLSCRTARRGPRMCRADHRADRRSAIARQSDRESHTRLSSRERNQPPPSNHPQYWRHYSNGDCRHGRRRQGVQIRTSFRGVDRAGATTERNRRQGPSWPDIEEGRSLYTQAARSRRDRRYPLRQEQA